MWAIGRIEWIKREATNLLRIKRPSGRWYNPRIKRNATNLLRVGIVLLFMLLAIWAITLNRYELVIANQEPWLWLTIGLVSVGPELAGIVIGVVTIDYLNERRQDEQLKAQLVLQMGSAHNVITDTAIRALRARNWLYDGSLSGALLADSNLTEAGLWRADMRKTILVRANLSGAYLPGANLSEAILSEANLSGARLMKANLSGVDLTGANLCGANNWTIEQLEQAETLQGAIMPDGVQLGWAETEWNERIDGPTFEEWKVQYLAKQDAEKVEIKPNSEPADTADG